MVGPRKWEDAGDMLQQRGNHFKMIYLRCVFNRIYIFSQNQSYTTYKTGKTGNMFQLMKLSSGLSENVKN
jgi:hypothetical protein